MNIVSKFAAITFAVLALGASAQAQSNGGGQGGGAGASGGGGEPGLAMMAAGGPISHVVAPEPRKRPARVVRAIPIYNCGDGISISSGHLCQPVLR